MVALLPLIAMKGLATLKKSQLMEDSFMMMLMTTNLSNPLCKRHLLMTTLVCRFDTNWVCSVVLCAL